MFKKFLLNNIENDVLPNHDNNVFNLTKLKIEPRKEISNNVVFATSKGSDQPAHTRSLIRAFTSRLDIQWVLSYWLNII